MTTPRTLLTACAVVLFLVAGCSRWSEVTHSSDVPRSPTDFSVQGMHHAAQVPLILSPIQVSQNGSGMTTTSEFERRVLSHLDRAHLFSYLTHEATGPPPDQQHVRARLTVKETAEPHSGENAFKGFVVGASMFLLTPWLPFEYDFSAQMVLDIERWDGQAKRYLASSEGKAYFHLFGATPLTIPELEGRVTESCLTNLTQQLIADTAFFTAPQTVALTP